MDQYFSDHLYRWDEDAKAAYLCIDKEESENDKFISFDNERSIRAKFEYVERNKLGGVIIWELGGGYRKKMPAGQRDLLLQQVKDIVRN
jgi:GH18 family chitinase